MLPATQGRDSSSAANLSVSKVTLIHGFSELFFYSGATSTDSIIVVAMISNVLILVCISVLVFFLCKRRKKTTIEPVVKEEDNPDYGTYYYADGDRRQDVMEVNFDLYGNIV